MQGKGPRNCWETPAFPFTRSTLSSTRWKGTSQRTIRIPWKGSFCGTPTFSSSWALLGCFGQSRKQVETRGTRALPQSLQPWSVRWMNFPLPSVSRRPGSWPLHASRFCGSFLPLSALKQAALCSSFSPTLRAWPAARRCAHTGPPHPRCPACGCTRRACGPRGSTPGQAAAARPRQSEQVYLS